MYGTEYFFTFSATAYLFDIFRKDINRVGVGMMSDIFAEYIDACKHDFKDIGQGWVKCRICEVIAQKEGVD